MTTTFAQCVIKGAKETVLLEKGVVYRLEGDMFGEFSKGAALCPADEVERFLPPVSPSKIPSVGLNYRDHAREVGLPIPEEPLLFLKPPTTVAGHKDPVVYPTHMSARVDYEAELAIVIGKKCSCVEAHDALDYVLGYTCANDVTARDLQTKDGQWTRAKSFDTFCPLGPWIVSGIDPSNLDISLVLNGKEVQRSNTKNFIFPVEVLVSHVSKVMTLLPGDVIITGTPSGIGPVEKGDVMQVVIEGIGVLENRVDG
ncbi:MAG: fumarylacetoacetate hydrolase family protein [Aminivibrio sp.]|jgi:2-keto-4-pentenoate hydratase/2-oxohepta-3-ene-1,7-dioic acid hydratase in catechol pathway